MLDFLAIGELLIDFIPGDKPGTYVRFAGGAPANVAVSVARNGLKSGFCGKLGNDEFGEFLIRTLEENRIVNLCPAFCDEAITTMAFVTLDESGDRKFTFARKPGADMFLSVDDLPVQEIENCRILHTGTCSLSKGITVEATKTAMRIAAQSGQAKVSVDVNFRDVFWNNDRSLAKKALDDVIDTIDFLKMSEDEVSIIGGLDQVKSLIDHQGVSLVVVTRGENGAIAFCRDSIIESKGIKTKAVDTTGAGDAFWGAFLSFLLNKHDGYLKEIDPNIILDALTFANTSGMLSVQQKGAISSIPTRIEIQNYLQKGEKEGR